MTFPFLESSEDAKSFGLITLRILLGTGRPFVELARNLKVESVARLKPTRDHRLHPTSKVMDAIELMRGCNVGCVLICKGDNLLGIFSERDLTRRVLSRRLSFDTPIDQVMTHHPVVVSQMDPISLAIKKMLEGGYRHLPVVDDENRPVGILSVKRIVHYLAEHFPTLVLNLPPDPSQYPPCAEGA